jgi:hypothetical protein
LLPEFSNAFEMEACLRLVYRHQHCRPRTRARVFRLDRAPGRSDPFPQSLPAAFASRSLRVPAEGRAFLSARQYRAKASSCWRAVASSSATLRAFGALCSVQVLLRPPTEKCERARIPIGRLCARASMGEQPALIQVLKDRFPCIPS